MWHRGRVTDALRPDSRPDPRTSVSPPSGKRARQRLEVEAGILRVAREHLAVQGPAGLSLRAVARDLGMVSSGIYRYVQSRDDLLTRLIVDAYTSLAHDVLAAHDAVDPDDLAGRWHAVGRALRAWALEHPHDFALVYGTPVPDYVAPRERTVEPGTAVLAVLVRLLHDAHRAGRLDTTGWGEAGHGEAGAPADLPRRAVGWIVDDPMLADVDVPVAGLVRGVVAWTLLIGAVTGELFHQLGPVPDPEALFRCQLDVAERLVLTPPH